MAPSRSGVTRPAMDVFAPRVAVACSGLGNIQRGIEAWASDVAQGLREFGIDATLFSGGGAADATPLRHAPRKGLTARGIARAFRHVGGWRYGLGSPYEVEQTSFSLALWLRIRRSFDVLHVQDPLIALRLEGLHRAGLSRPKVIYANGTGETPAYMRRFRHLQLLTITQQHASGLDDGPSLRVHTIPNFVDIARFSPGNSAEARARLGLPVAGRILLCCSAIRRPHKRVDVLLQEFAAFAADAPDWHLVVAGGREADTDGIVAMGRELLGDRVRFLPDLPRGLVPDLCRAADAFTLASLYEMFGIVLIEAMSSGIPILCHDASCFREVVGPAGHFADLSQPGGLAGGMAALRDDDYRTRLALEARRHVEEHFSKGAVIPRVIDMYRATITGGV